MPVSHSKGSKKRSAPGENKNEDSHSKRANRNVQPSASPNAMQISFTRGGPMPTLQELEQFFDSDDDMDIQVIYARHVPVDPDVSHNRRLPLIPFLLVNDELFPDHNLVQIQVTKVTNNDGSNLPPEPSLAELERMFEEDRDVEQQVINPDEQAPMDDERE